MLVKGVPGHNITASFKTNREEIWVKRLLWNVTNVSGRYCSFNTRSGYLRVLWYGVVSYLNRRQGWQWCHQYGHQYQLNKFNGIGNWLLFTKFDAGKHFDWGKSNENARFHFAILATSLLWSSRWVMNECQIAVFILSVDISGPPSTYQKEKKARLNKPQTRIIRNNPACVPYFGAPVCNASIRIHF